LRAIPAQNGWSRSDHVRKPLGRLAAFAIRAREFLARIGRPIIWLISARESVRWALALILVAAPRDDADSSASGASSVLARSVGPSLVGRLIRPVAVWFSTEVRHALFGHRGRVEQCSKGIRGRQRRPTWTGELIAVFRHTE
jgi:hypothetical protein